MIDVEETRVKALVAALEDVDIEAALEQPMAPLAAGPPAAGAAEEEAAEADTAEEEEAEEEEPEEEEETSGEGLGSLFG